MSNSLNITKNLSRSNNELLIKFYYSNINNEINYNKKNDNLLICSYNVHDGSI